MEVDQRLILRLRDLAGQGASVRVMIGEIRASLTTDDGLALVADRYFTQAFLLKLGDVRPIEGCACLGGKVYSDEAIDRLMLPRIESTRDLWQEDPVASR